MENDDVLRTARYHVLDTIADFQAPSCDPVTVSPWVAMSLLQKAIRRGRGNLAFRAAATLLRDAPEKLWRRLACIAFEDIGLGDVDTVAQVTAGMTGKKFRASPGGEWATASFLVSKMADASKCRANCYSAPSAIVFPAYDNPILKNFDLLTAPTVHRLPVSNLTVTVENTNWYFPNRLSRLDQFRLPMPRWVLCKGRDTRRMTGF
jgi:hypothetical protein